LLDEVNQLLSEASGNDSDVISRLKVKGNPVDVNEEIDQSNIFTLEEIRTICIRYRLRFLDSTHFKSQYPYSAISEINAFEKKHQLKINSFRIIAPSKAFDLENINKDPLLFAQLNNNTYYLLHQWGHELSWYRKLIVWPLQNFKNLLITITICCFLFAFSIPSSVMHIFSFQSEMYLRIWLAIHTFIGVLGLTLWAGLAFEKTFSSQNWDSKYYNY
jgi:hypothetical protein